MKKDYLSLNFLIGALFLVHPIIIAILHPNILFLGLQQDPAQCLGSIINYDLLHQTFSTDRRLDRLPVIFFGHWFYKFFPGLAAHYLLYYLCFVLTEFLFFLNLKSILSTRSAFLSAIIFGVNFWVMPVFGDVWMTRQIFIFFLLSLFFAQKSVSDPENILKPIKIGFFSGFAFFSHFAALPFLFIAPFFTFTNHFLTKKLSLKKLLNFTNYFFNGFVVSFLLLACVNRFFFGGRFLFFLNQFSISMADYSNRSSSFVDIWAQPSNSLIFITIITCLLYNFTTRKPDDKIKTISIWFLTASATYFIFCLLNEFLPKSPIFTRVLIREFFRLWFYPICAVALFSCLMPKDISWSPLKILLFYFGLLISVSSLPSIIKIIPLIPINTTLLTLTGIFATTCILLKTIRWGMALGFALLFFMNSLLIAKYPFNEKNGYANAAYYQRLYEGNTILRNLPSRSVYYWVDENPDNIDIWDELKAYGHLWLCDYNPTIFSGFPIFGPGPAGLTDYLGESLKENSYILLLSKIPDRDLPHLFNSKLVGYGKELEVLLKTQFGIYPNFTSATLCKTKSGQTLKRMPPEAFSNRKYSAHLINGDFVEGLSGWNPPGDVSPSLPGKADFESSFSTDSYIDGKKSILLNVNNHTIGMNTTVSNLDPQKLYSLKIRYKIIHSDKDGKNNKTISRHSIHPNDLYYFYDSFGAIPSMNFVDVKGRTVKKNGWQEENIIFMARDQNATLYLYCSSDGNMRVSCYFDSVKIEALKKP